jgi:hypothetical protein
VEDGSADAVDDDGDVSTTPEQATQTLSVLEHVYAVEVTNMGYRPPVPDADSADSGDAGSTANDAKTDIYLADVGADDLYGYCTTDDPDAINFTEGDRQVSSYCVLDNDYDAAQFPYHTPLQNLQVTAAHEFFHAIQNAYDWLEDPWLVEGTATWMEDEVYDSINDNRQYLDASPLSAPFYPLDYGTDSTAGNLDILKYGVWIWWRFLSERAGSGAADDPTIVRQVWEDAVTRYSTSALNAVLAQRGSNFADWFAAFGTWTSNPASYFSEGSAYPKPEPDASFTLSSSHKTTGSLSTTIDHMARSFVTVKPASGLSSTVKLKVAVNLADTSHGSVAQAVIHKKSGGLSIKRIPLSSTGYANVTYGFSPSEVSYIKLDFANASTKFACQRDTGDVYESCHGEPTYDAQEARFNATLTH